MVTGNLGLKPWAIKSVAISHSLWQMWRLTARLFFVGCSWYSKKCIQGNVRVILSWCFFLSCLYSILWTYLIKWFWQDRGIICMMAVDWWCLKWKLHRLIMQSFRTTITQKITPCKIKIGNRNSSENRPKKAPNGNAVNC